MNSTATATVAAFFSTETEAGNAIRDLKTAGFSSNQIGLALASGRGTSDSSTVNAASTSTTGIRHTGKVPSQAHAKAESAWERFKEFFTGGDGDVEPYADERDRGSATAGEITGPSAATSAQPGQYGHEDVTGSLTGLGIPENRARYLARKLRSGSNGAVVTVNAGPRRQEAEEILTSRGGDLGANATSQDYAAAEYAGGQSGPGAANLPEREQPESSDQQRIELLGEVLRVHKERIQRGEVRIRKEVVVEQQTVQVPVTREEIVVERVPADQSTPSQGQIGADSEIRVPLTEERATLEKQTVVREQVNVGKRNVEGVENLQDSVRREELNVADSTTNPTRR